MIFSGYDEFLCFNNSSQITMETKESLTSGVNSWSKNNQLTNEKSYLCWFYYGLQQ